MRTTIDAAEITVDRSVRTNTTVPDGRRCARVISLQCGRTALTDGQVGLSRSRIVRGMDGVDDERWLVDAHGVRVFTRWWTPPTPAAPTAIVMVLHSVADHSGRYDEVARRLNDEGFAVVALDLRGHGNTGLAAARGLQGLRGGRAVLDDIHLLRTAALEEFGALPVFLLGHATGSLIALAYLAHHSVGLAGAVLTAIPADVDDLASVAQLLQGASEAGMRDERVLDQFGTYNGPFEPARTPFDWLSRDEAEVDRYIADPTCGDDQPVTFGFLIDLFNVIAAARDHFDEFACPILNLAGSADVMGEVGRYATTLAAALDDVGVDVCTTIYEGARNDLLHEINRADVVADVVAWCRVRIAALPRPTAP